MTLEPKSWLHQLALATWLEASQMVAARRYGYILCVVVIVVTYAATVPSVREDTGKNASSLRDQHYWQLIEQAPDLASAYPVTVMIHAGFRPASSPDVSLHNISLSSLIYSFVDQWNQNNASAGLNGSSLLVFWSLDVQSFETHEHSLLLEVSNLQSLSLSFRLRHPWMEFRFVFSSGIAASYRRVLNHCNLSAWCRYVFLVEEDWFIEHDRILAPISDLVAVLDGHLFMNYVRFNQHPNNLDSEQWDGPCLMRDPRVQGKVPFMMGAGFSNNPHVSRASNMALLVDDIFDPNQVADRGLEHFSFTGRTHVPGGLYAMCALLAYDCMDQPLFLSDDFSCQWRQYNSTEADVFERRRDWMNTFVRNKTDCFNEAGQQPNFDHCGLYMYGDWDDSPRIFHLNGKTFTPSTFWQHPKSPFTSQILPYFTAT